MLLFSSFTLFSNFEYGFSDITVLVDDEDLGECNGSTTLDSANEKTGIPTRKDVVLMLFFIRVNLLVFSEPSRCTDRREN